MIKDFIRGFITTLGIIGGPFFWIDCCLTSIFGYSLNPIAGAIIMPYLAIACVLWIFAREQSK